MEWFLGHQRGPPWKHSWASRVLSSAAIPPFPLVVILAIVLLLLSISGYVDYSAQVQRTAVGFHLFLVVPVVLILAAVYCFRDGMVAPARRPEWVEQRSTAKRDGSSPWGVGLLVVLLLVMVSYQSYFHSQWFRGLWGSS